MTVKINKIIKLQNKLNSVENSIIKQKEKANRIKNQIEEIHKALRKL